MFRGSAWPDDQHRQSPEQDVFGLVRSTLGLLAQSLFSAENSLLKKNKLRLILVYHEGSNNIKLLTVYDQVSVIVIECSI
jgi:hypothetical protein